MMRIVRGLVYIGVVFAVVAAGALIWYGWALDGFAGTSKIEDRIEVTSPDGRYVASGYHVWGGATVQNCTVFTLRQKQPGTDEMSIMVVDMTGPNNPFAMHWADNTHLTVTYNHGSIYSKESNWQDVRVSYDEK